MTGFFKIATLAFNELNNGDCVDTFSIKNALKAYTEKQTNYKYLSTFSSYDDRYKIIKLVN